MVKQFEVYLINLDPTTGSEIKKTRPCVVISPNEMHGLNTVIIAPMTSTCKLYPTRIPVFFEKKEGYIVLDQNTRQIEIGKDARNNRKRNCSQCYQDIAENVRLNKWLSSE